ncbi:PREDICTED: ninja-family protein AFP3 [Nelumbo nucifera]|uniref:Ninja-family protein n=1 Tax=Nelumbo nucifera TaxID=4432 RepID=A0A1U8A7W9_NELNU|nr:PREDICTED: ninja-family protein AFP3 [Nelumbo nucifera]
MREARETEPSEIEHLPVQMSGHPRDLLKRFSATNYRPSEFAEAREDTEEIELNLGLSLGGCFGVDPREKRLVRSSSIAGLTTMARDEDASAPPPAACSALTRTCSLPTETEEERRKRKELQCLRRMEAKRKRSEKQRNSRAGKDRASLEGNCEEDKRLDDEVLLSLNLKGKVENITSFQGFTSNALAKQQQQQPQPQQQYMTANDFTSSAAPTFGLLTWAAAAQGAAHPHGMDTSTNGKGNVLAAAFPMRGYPPPSSQGSLGSQGSSSSGVSEFESRPVQGLSSCSEARSPTSVQSLPENCEQKPTASPAKTLAEMPSKFAGVEMETSKKPNVVDNGLRELGRNMMDEMPCVSTRGDGPNGKRIEGFLYKYRKGEEVRIVCVCHGSFLSPAEFVKHAGGGDVAHPLRHIVVNPSPSSLL